MVFRGRAALSRFVVGLAVFILPQTTAMGSIVPLLTTAELTKESDVAITGTVLSLSSRWNEAHENIFTYVEIQVDTVVKGNPDGGNITLKLYGGIVGTTTIAVSNSPRFAIEERVLLFLEAFDRDPKTRAPLNYIPYNMDQGKLSILVNDEGEEVLFWPSAMRYRPKSTTEVAPAFLGSPQLLSDMVRDIAACVKKDQQKSKEKDKGANAVEGGKNDDN